MKLIAYGTPAHASPRVGRVEGDVVVDLRVATGWTDVADTGLGELARATP